MQKVFILSKSFEEMSLGQWDAHMAMAGNDTGMTPDDEKKAGFVSYDQRMNDWQHSQTAFGMRAEIGEDVGKANVGLPFGYDKQWQRFDSLASQKKATGDFKFGGNAAIDDEILEAAMAEARRVGLDA